MPRDTEGLTKWFEEEWVDIGAPKKKGKYQSCGRKSAKGSIKRKVHILNVYQILKLHQ